MQFYVIDTNFDKDYQIERDEIFYPAIVMDLRIGSTYFLADKNSEAIIVSSVDNKTKEDVLELKQKIEKQSQEIEKQSQEIEALKTKIKDIDGVTDSETTDLDTTE